ncbi:3-deoxy-D-manno-octulosonic acid transferase [Flagellimonas halotolerans]|uniref:3-deoxy-D-manno-octulosonic acid transferase n=1 Tax=Flagellimonas halotolerans TaxID=3112164 RepID=A0ABU6IMH8_9FLAO|nr:MULTISPECIES: glycosyltransferase N-terminal domain-containing protein [unclassified Allomuricauda]MEC3964358.1 glycosyltransferase N-terminal domain-containing protein [Muricauda sp. SYSU M86414]MEC4264228.1 glycosyltransferase N-terminal domain-containing protein [Muricauda sp. SYSU M84420]
MPLRFLYNILINIAWLGLNVIALFNAKIKLFVQGRKLTFPTLEDKFDSEDRTIWMHVASLGEFEQGLPILERLRSKYPDHKLVLSFFSPSGYEVKKNSLAADLVVYLPMDSNSKVKRFLNLVNPELAIFVKYEVWPNYLYHLKKRNIPTILVSAIFSGRQIYFKPYGGFMRKSLGKFDHYFVQDKNSKKLLESIGFTTSSISGDTRLDRVSEILERNNQLDFMDRFKNNQLCLVAGSTWPEDEEILINYINNSKEKVKFVIAPHEIKPAHIEKITSSLQKRTVLYSTMGNQNLKEFDVLVVDTIGLLTKIYSYANIAYVGGGFATGLHNTMEPAVFGIPIIIGPQFEGFKEAEDLVNEGGILPISSKDSFDDLVIDLLNNPVSIKNIGAINSNYINSNRGAADLIMKHISKIM